MEQRRFAAALACDLCVHAAKTLLRPPLPPSSPMSRPAADSASESSTVERDPQGAALGRLLAITARDLCGGLEASGADVQPSRGSNYSGAGTQHQCLWVAVHRELESQV